MGKNLSSKHGQKLLDSTKQVSKRCAIKTTSTRATQKTEETTSNLVGKKITEKVKKMKQIYEISV